MGPIPRGPLILCIGPKLGWPVKETELYLIIYTWPKIAFLAHGQVQTRYHTLWPCGIHVGQHGMRTRAATWWLPEERHKEFNETAV